MENRGIWTVLHSWCVFKLLPQRFLLRATWGAIQRPRRHGLQTTVTGFALLNAKHHHVYLCLVQIQFSQDKTKDDNEMTYQSKHSVDAGYLQSLDCYTHWWIFIKGGGGGRLWPTTIIKWDWVNWSSGIYAQVIGPIPGFSFNRLLAGAVKTSRQQAWTSPHPGWWWCTHIKETWQVW